MLPELEEQIIAIETDTIIQNAKNILSAIPELGSSVIDVATRVAKL